MIKQLERDISEALPFRNGFRLTHLFFADDSLLFCKTSIQECNHIQDILLEYETALSQKLNKDKTTLFFNKVTSPNTQESNTRSTWFFPLLWEGEKRQVLLSSKRGFGPN